MLAVLYNRPTPTEKSANLFTTAFFIFFFFQFFRNLALYNEINRREIMSISILLFIWYGLSLSFV